MAQSLLDILKADSGTSSANRMLQSERQEGQSLLERLKAYDAPKIRTYTANANKTNSTPKPSTTGPVSIQAGPYATYHYNVSAQPAEQTYTPGQAIQGKTPAAGQRTTAQGIAAMTDAQKRKRMQELAPFVRPSVENVTPKKITDEMMLSGEIARNEEEYKALASGLSHNAFIHNAIDQGLTMGLGSAMQNVWLNQDAQSEKGLDEYKYLQSIQASRELNPTAAKWGGIAGGLLGSAALYGTVGKGAEAAANTLLGKLAPNAANSTLGKIMTAFAGQQAADTAIQTPVVALKSTLEGNDAGQIVGDVLEDQMWNAIGNVGMMGLEKFIKGMKSVYRNAKQNKQALEEISSLLGNDVQAAKRAMDFVKNGSDIGKEDFLKVYRAYQSGDLQNTSLANMLDSFDDAASRISGIRFADTGKHLQLGFEQEPDSALKAFLEQNGWQQSPFNKSVWMGQNTSVNKQFAEEFVGGQAQRILQTPESIKAASDAFAKQVDAWREGVLPVKESLSLGNTPDALVQSGAPQLPLKMDQSVLRKITGPLKNGGHELGDDLVKQLPTQLNDPLLVFKSRSQPNSLVVITEMTDQKQNPIIVAVRMNAKEKYYEVNKIASAYGKRGVESFLQKHIDEGNLLYANKEKAAEWLQLRGLQLPPVEPSNSFPNNSISQNTQNSNTFGPNTVGAAEGAFKNADDYIEQHGALPKGKQQPRARDIDLPAQTDAGKTAKFAQTMAEAGITSDQAAQNIRQAVAEGDYAFVPVSNKTAWQTADSYYENRGPQEALADFKAWVRSDKINTKTVALGEYLYKKAADAGDMEMMGQIAPDLALAFTEAGRTVQKAQLLKRLTPEDNVFCVERELAKFNEGLKKRGIEPLSLTNEMRQSIMAQKTPEGILKAVNAVYAQLSEQAPKTWVDKLNAWRYFAMLGNPRTQVRNFVGNAVFYPVRKLKNIVGAGLENATNRALQAFGKDPIERTKTLTRADEATKAFVKEDWLKNKDALMNGGKFNPQSILRDSSSAFKSVPMQKMDKGLKNLMEATDGLALGNAYRDSLAQYITVNKWTPEFLRSGTKAAGEALQKAQNYAAQEALKATYRDASALANALNKVRNVNSVTKFALNSALPFTKTPINVAKRGIEYSPIGLVNTAAQNIYKAARYGKNAVNAAEVIDGLASGLTGSALVAVGAWLASLGILSGAQDDTRKANNYERTLGKQEYSLNIGDWSYTIDWASPTVMPMMVGVEIYDQFVKEGDGTKGALDKALNAVTNITEPVFNLSMLQGVMDAVRTFQQDSGAQFADIALNAVESYANQFVPTLFGQIARTIDPTRRSTSGDPNSPVSKNLDSVMRAFMAKTPGASFLLEPNLDQWGREQKQNPAADNPMLSLINNAFLPWYSRQNNETPVDEEINRLREATGEQSVIPSYASRYYTIDGVKTDLSPSDYTTYQRTKGQTAYKTIEQMLDNSGYKQLSDTEKAKVIEKVYDYSNELAKAKVDSGYLPDKWVQNAQEAQRAGIPISTYLVSRQVINEMRADKDAQGKTIAGSKKQKVFQYINSLPLTAKQKEKLFGYYY